MNDTSNKIKAIAITGPTASGKTALAVDLAEIYGGEVVCCDSMQIYRGMETGSAAPDESERRGIPHHLFASVDPARRFSCADYTAAAASVMREINSRGAIPVLCGGTGLYLDRLIRGAPPRTANDPAYRDKLLSESADGGADRLYARLCEADPEAAAKIHPNNTRRVVRALEMIRAAGMSKTELDRRANLEGSDFEIKVIGLRFADRERLYRRIEIRVDEMIAGGLADEAKQLWERGLLDGQTTAGQAIGYKELKGYFMGEYTLDEAAGLIKTATRKYAKRQMTWFSAKDYVRWVTVY